MKTILVVKSPRKLAHRVVDRRAGLLSAPALCGTRPNPNGWNKKAVDTKKGDCLRCALRGSIKELK